MQIKSIGGHHSIFEIFGFFSSEIYGTEEAYKKASEAQEELSSRQYERR